MLRAPRAACAALICALCLNAGSALSGQTAPATAPARSRGAAPPRNDGSAPPRGVPKSFSLDPQQIRGRLRGAQLEVRSPLPSVPQAGQLTAAILDLSGRALARITQSLAASQGKTSLRLRLPLGPHSGPDADLLRLSWRFTPLAGGFTEGIVALSEILDVPFLSVRGQETLVAGSRAALRLTVRDQRDRPLPEVQVTLRLQAGARALVARGASAEAGDLHLAVDLPDSWAGAKAQLLVDATAGPFRRQYRAQVTVRREAQLLLTLDKPIYQPGHNLHLRVLALRQPSRRPLSGRRAVFRLRDPRGTLLAEQQARTDAFGAAWTTLPLSEGVRPGTFQVEAAVTTDGRNQVEATRRIKVHRYEVPDFRVTLHTTQAWAQPGRRTQVTLTAQTLSGQPLRQAPATVAATLVVQRNRGRSTRRCVRELEALKGRTDHQGQWTFDVPSHRLRPFCGALPDAVILSAEVEALGGVTQRASRSIQVSFGPLRIAATPEAGLLVRGVPQRLLLQAVRPDGGPVRATFTVKLPSSALPTSPVSSVAKTGSPSPGPAQGEAATIRTIRLHTDADGLAELTVRPVQDTLYLAISAKDAQGHHAARSLGLAVTAPRVLVRPEPGVLTAGSPLRLALTTPGEGDVVQVEVKQGAQTVHTATGRMTGTRGQMELKIPAAVDGLLGLAVRVRSPSGAWQEGFAPVLVRPSRWLNVQVASDQKIYAPGGTAHLTLRVTDEAGQGQGAALDLRLVDEGVFLLAGRTPDSEHGELLLPEEWRGNGSGVSGFTLMRLMREPRTAVPERVAQLLLSRLLEGAWSLAEDTLVHDGSEAVPAYRRGLARRLMKRLAGEFRARFLNYASVQRRRWQALGRKRSLCMGEDAPAESPESLVEEGALPKALLEDPWGRPLAWIVDRSNTNNSDRYRVTLHSLGPDGIDGSEDDLDAGPWWLRVPPLPRNQRCGVGYGAGGLGAIGAGSFASRRPMVFMSRAGVMGHLDSGALGRAFSESPTPRTRWDFRETLAVFPGLRTGTDGTVKVTVPLADNLTTWAITALASDREGRLGGQVARLRTFQPFSVDVRIPPIVTRGDELTARVVVRNELPTPQWLRVSLRAADWFAALPAPGTHVSLQPGATGPRLLVTPGQESSQFRSSLLAPKSAVEIPFGIRVTRLGRHELHVTAQTPSHSDAVQRPVQVEPEGVEQHAGASGLLSSVQTHDLRLPDSLVPDTTGVEVTLEPDVLASTWGSFEGLLRRPTGCFEQTSSTTYPNLLVMRHLQHGKGSRQARRRAQAFLAQGYQRLVSFEVQGSGGFSLFGHAPAQPMLTAFGLGEFHDLGRVMTVDQGLVRRIQRYLVGRQRADGSFLPEGRLIESGSTSPADALAATAYVALQLGRSGFRGPALVRALALLRRRGVEAQGDTYTLALSIRALLAGGRAPDAALARRWAGALAALGRRTARGTHWPPGGVSTLTGQGAQAAVETTALAVLALLETGTRLDLVPPAVRWILSRRAPDGAWQTTQATVLALEALLGAQSLIASRPPARVKVFLDDALLGVLEPARAAHTVPARISLSRPLGPGLHRLQLRPEGAGRALYRVSLRYHTLDPPPPQGDAASRVRFAVRWSRLSAAPGDALTATVQIDNGLGRSLDAPMAEIGLPTGLRLLEGSLGAQVSQGLVSQWERRGSRLLLYFSRLPTGKTVIPLRLQAEAPLAARIPPSRLYEYYRPETSWTVQSSRIEVKAPVGPSGTLSQLLRR